MKKISTYDINKKYRRRKKRHTWKYELFTALFAAVLILCAYAGKINPSGFFPAPFLTLAYMPMLIVALLFLLVTLLCRRWLAALVIIAAFVLTLPVSGSMCLSTTLRTLLPCLPSRRCCSR